MMNEVIDHMLKKRHKVITFPVYEEWQDIGNKEDYFKLKEKIKKVMKKILLLGGNGLIGSSLYSHLKEK